MKNIKFRIKFKLAPSHKKIFTEEFEISLDGGKDETSLTYDEVFFAGLDTMEKEYPEDDFPNIKLIETDIFSEEDSKWYPVVSEGGKKIKDPDTMAAISDCEKYLVLPDAEWRVSDEYMKYSALLEAGINVGEFDPEKMRKLIEIEKKNETDGNDRA
jgi:hypothetical protein